MKYPTIYRLLNLVLSLFPVLVGVLLVMPFQVGFVLANEGIRADICSGLVSGEGNEDLAEIYLSLLRELRQVFPEDWSLILDSVVSSDTALNPLSGETVETTGYFQSFEWLVGQDFKWSRVREEAQRWQAELDEEKMREKTDEENARQATVVEMRLGPSHKLVTSASPQIGLPYYRQPDWIEIDGEFFLIFNDYLNRLASINVFSGETRVIRQHKSDATQVTTFEFGGRYYAIYGLFSRDVPGAIQVSGVEMTDLVSGDRIHFWPGLEIEVPPKRIGSSQGGKPRFLLDSRLSQIKSKSELVELTFGSEKVIERKVQEEGDRWFIGDLLQFLSSGKKEYLLIKSRERGYIVFSYPDLDYVASYESETSTRRAKNRHDLNAPTLYVDAQGNVRLAMGAPMRADSEIARDVVLEEIEVGTRVLPGLPLAFPGQVSQSRYGSISQPPVILSGERKLTVLSKRLSRGERPYDVLYVIDLYSDEIMSKVRLNDEMVYELFAVQLIEIDGELYLFFVSISNNRRTTLNLIAVLNPEEMHRFEFKVSKNQNSDFSIIPTGRGLLAIEIRNDFDIRSVFLTSEVK